MNKTDYPRCKTCKFWSIEKTGKRSKTGICQKISTKYNTPIDFDGTKAMTSNTFAFRFYKTVKAFCEAIPMLSKNEKYLEDEAVSELWTLFDFGCIQHEPKESEG